MPAYASLRERHPGYALDGVEVTPREAREELVGRILDAALASDLADVQITVLRATSLARDPHMPAVPRALPDLSKVVDPARNSLHSTCRVAQHVRYAFDIEHSARVDAWYDALMPRAEPGVRCRSCEAALAVVEAGLCTALVPELAVRLGSRLLSYVALYAVPLPQRQTVLLMPAHGARLPRPRCPRGLTLHRPRWFRWRPASHRVSCGRASRRMARVCRRRRGCSLPARWTLGRADDPYWLTYCTERTTF